VVTIRPLTLGLFSSSSASRSVRNRALARLRSKARWWLGERPSFRPRLRCRMAMLFRVSGIWGTLCPRHPSVMCCTRLASNLELRAGNRRHTHSQAQPQLGELFLDFVQSRLAEVANLQQLIR